MGRFRLRTLGVVAMALAAGQLCGCLTLCHVLTPDKNLRTREVTLGSRVVQTKNVERPDLVVETRFDNDSGRHITLSARLARDRLELREESLGLNTFCPCIEDLDQRPLLQVPVAIGAFVEMFLFIPVLLDGIVLSTMHTNSIERLPGIRTAWKNVDTELVPVQKGRAGVSGSGVNTGGDLGSDGAAKIQLAPFRAEFRRAFESRSSIVLACVVEAEGKTGRASVTMGPKELETALRGLDSEGPQPVKIVVPK